MSDQSYIAHVRTRTPRRVPRAEYLTYFTLILILALPVQCAVWVGTLIRSRSLPAKGPLARALRDAEAITPSIFRP